MSGARQDPLEPGPMAPHQTRTLGHLVGSGLEFAHLQALEGPPSRHVDGWDLLMAVSSAQEPELWICLG